MGGDLTIRQERFITEYLRSLATTPYAKGNASRAYMLAGYKPTTRNALDVSAHQLLNHPKIQRRLAARKRAMLKRSDITIEKLLSDAEEARKLAIETKQASAATGATQLQAKLVGLLIERKESGAPGEFAGLETPAQVIEAVRLELGEDAAKALQMLVNKPVDSKPAESPLPTVTGTEAIN